MQLLEGATTQQSSCTFESLPSLPRFLKFHLELPTRSSRPRVAAFDSRGTSWASGSRSVRSDLLKSSWRPILSTSLASWPNGFSSSMASMFKAHMRKTCRKAKARAHPKDGAYSDETTGVTNQCKISKQSTVCAKGKGNGTSPSFLASLKCNMP